MRLIPLSKVKVGDKLTHDIYERRGKVLLKRNKVLTKRYIDKIKELGIYYIYVESEFVDNNLSDVINPKVRIDLINKFKEVINDFKRVLDGKIRTTSRYIKAVNAFENSIRFMAKEIERKTLTQSDLSVVDIKREYQYEYEHVVDVAIISYLIGKTYPKLAFNYRSDLIISALLMNISLFYLSDEEKKEQYKNHPTKSYQILKEHTQFNSRILEAVKTHHEHHDGEGYPNNVSGESINLLSKIISVADIYDKITSKKPLGSTDINHQHEAFEYIMGQGNRKFDIRIVKLFARKMSPYPVGTYVRLSNGKKGVVIRRIRNYPLRPEVKLFDTKEVVQLIEDNTITIKEVIYRKED